MKILLFSLFFCFTANLSFSQSLIEQLGGVSTSFKITSNQEPIEVLQQYIIKKDNLAYDTDGTYAYESYHLEFLTPDNLEQQVVYRDLIFSKKGILIKLYDNNGELLTETHNNQYGISLHTNKVQGHHLFSVNLRGIPFIYLNEAASIDIIYANFSRKK